MSLIIELMREEECILGWASGNLGGAFGPRLWRETHKSQAGSRACRPCFHMHLFPQCLSCCYYITGIARAFAAADWFGGKYFPIRAGLFLEASNKVALAPAEPASSWVFMFRKFVEQPHARSELCCSILLPARLRGGRGC